MTETFEPLTRAQRLTVAGTAIVVALTRFLALAKGPWDWDEILFCMAVNDYNVAAHQPHPPGFPFYIFLARIVRFFTDSDFHALQTVNVIAAMLVLPVMFAVARAFRLDFVTSLWAAFLFAFLPNVWFYGGTAFSDVPAMLLFLGAIAAFLFAARTGSARTYFLASIILAAGMMIRPQNAIVALFPWGVATWELVRAKRLRIAIIGASLAAGLTALGYGIAAWVTDFESYFTALYLHSKYVTAADAITATARPPLYKVAAMMIDPYEAGKVSIVINVLMFIGVLWGIARGPRRPLREILLTFAPFFIFAMFAVNPLGASRFSLNWLAGVVLLAALGTNALASIAPRLRVAVFLVVIAVLTGRLIPWTLPAFEEPRKHDAPPVAAAKWVEANVPRTSTVFVDESIWPWAKYYIPTHRQERPGDPSRLVKDVDSETGVYLSMVPLQVRNERSFVRPKNRTWNLVTQRSFEAYVTPARSFVTFDNGWWGQEGQWPDVWRWSSKRASIRFAPMKNPGELHLKFVVPVELFTHPVRVSFLLNGKLIGTHVATRSENEVRYIAMPRSDATNVLRIEVSDTFIPSRLTKGDGDWRQLGIMLQSWDWKPLEPAVLRKAS
jgi:hypothetical protein